MTSAGSNGSPPGPESPTVFHVAHCKAGSQWLHRILLEAVPESIVPPEIDNAQVLGRPVQPGRVCPTSDVTHEELLSVAPPNSHWFVVIRDLRDTLVSAHYSLKFSHPVIDPEVADVRDGLGQLTSERGLLAVMDPWPDMCARIQDSWLQAREPMIRYEHLLENDLAILEPVLLDRCALPVAPEASRGDPLPSFDRSGRLPRRLARISLTASLRGMGGCRQFWRLRRSSRVSVTRACEGCERACAPVAFDGSRRQAGPTRVGVRSGWSGMCACLGWVRAAPTAPPLRGGAARRTPRSRAPAA
jgi:hypothetical protein